MVPVVLMVTGPSSAPCESSLQVENITRATHTFGPVLFWAFLVLGFSFRSYLSAAPQGFFSMSALPGTLPSSLLVSPVLLWIFSLEILEQSCVLPFCVRTLPSATSNAVEYVIFTVQRVAFWEGTWSQGLRSFLQPSVWQYFLGVFPLPGEGQVPQR